jgi:homospermidine synthase
VNETHKDSIGRFSFGVRAVYPRRRTNIMAAIVGVLALTFLYIDTFINPSRGDSYDSDYDNLINDYLICRYAEANEKTE